MNGQGSRTRADASRNTSTPWRNLFTTRASNPTNGKRFGSEGPPTSWEIITIFEEDADE